jgi:Cu+-exporting ATPase
MANASLSPPSEQGSVPSSVSVPSGCPGCGEAVDPLRAGHVAVLAGRFRYFCRSECKQAYLRASGRELEEDVPTARPPDVAPSSVSSIPPGLPAPAEGEPTSAPTSELARATLPSPTAGDDVADAARARAKRRAEVAIALLDTVGIAAAVLAPALALLGPAADDLRAPLLLSAWCALALRSVLVRRDAADVHSLVVLVPTAGATGAAIAAEATRDPRAFALVVLAALSSAVAILVEVLVGRARGRVLAERARIERALEVPVRVVRGDDAVIRAASEVRPGEQVVALAGEVVGVDATVVAGEAAVVPWLGARIEVVKREGDPVVAGARVVSNRLRLTTTWSGRERAWVKLSSAAAARVEVAAPTARALRHTVERGAPLAAALVGVAAFAASATPVEIVAAACAGAIAFAAKAVVSVVALHFARAHLDALASGITFKDARSFERAASTSLAVLSARGTVLMGEPEIVAVEPVGPLEVQRVLSLAAGAETASTHPFAAAVARAARVRGVRPDPVRNATAHTGLGVTASASTGEKLVVGGRAIMLAEKIGVAVVESRVTELEGQGRSVLLVALADRIVGVIALQDGLRSGARGAVQRLLDARIEPVLLSGEARETCETIGRALDIEHVRPEVLPADRGGEVRALSEGGSVVAVVGHPARDDGALAAADVAVAMGAAGSTPGEWAVALAADDVREAAMALAIPRAARDRARVAMALGLTPCALALLAISFGIAPLAVAPLAALTGAIAVAVHAREAAPRRRG